MKRGIISIINLWAVQSLKCDDRRWSLRFFYLRIKVNNEHKEIKFMGNNTMKMTKYKRWVLYGLTGICLLGGFSCTEEYDDTWIKEAIEDLQDRVTNLEDWCQTANSNISSLRSLATALEECDYITGVTPVTENGVEIGYTITFKDAPAIIIYHGQDGEKGDSASVPMIGVSKGDDGRYYWTQTVGDADPEFILDEAGKKIAASGMAPRLSVDSEGYWLIDVDGQGFKRLKDVDGNDVKAVGEKGDTGDPGETGPQGPAGNSIFSKVDYSDPTYVIFYLNDGTEIQLPRYNLTDTQAEYDALAQAISEATGTPDNPTVIELTGDILMGENPSFRIEGDKHIVIDGKGHTIVRSDGYSCIFLVSDGSSLILRNVILDGDGGSTIQMSSETSGTDITTVTLEDGVILQNGGSRPAIWMYGARFQMKGNSIIKDVDVAIAGDDAPTPEPQKSFVHFYGGKFLNCQTIVNLTSIQEFPKIHIAQMPQIDGNGKLKIESGFGGTGIIGQIVAPEDGCQLNLDDFDFDVWTDDKPYKIYLDNDGIIKIKVGE